MGVYGIQGPPLIHHASMGDSPPRWMESTWVDTIRVQKFGVPKSPSKWNLCKCGSFKGPPSYGIRTSVGRTFVVPRPVLTECRIRGSPVPIRKKLVHGPFEVLRHRQRASGCAKIPPIRLDGEGVTIQVREIWGSWVHLDNICASVGGPRSALV